MRAIAAEADVSLGNAYYYFKSKEPLIQAFDDRTHLEHAEAAAPLLEREADLAARIVGVAEAWVDVMEPYRAFAGRSSRPADRQVLSARSAGNRQAPGEPPSRYGKT